MLQGKNWKYYINRVLVWPCQQIYETGDKGKILQGGHDFRRSLPPILRPLLVLPGGNKYKKKTTENNARWQQMLEEYIRKY